MNYPEAHSRFFTEMQAIQQTVSIGQFEEAASNSVERFNSFSSLTCRMEDRRNDVEKIRLCIDSLYQVLMRCNQHKFDLLTDVTIMDDHKRVMQRSIAAMASDVFKVALKQIQ